MKKTCLQNKEWLLSKFCKEMYTNGVISKNSYDAVSIPLDRDMNGFTVSRDLSINQENRQRAKILSSPTQIREQQLVVYEKQKEHYLKLIQLYKNETKDCVNNKKCENKLVNIMLQYNCILNPSSSVDLAILSPTFTTSTFKEVCCNMTIDLLMSKKLCILLHEDRAFVKVCSKTFVVHGKRTFKNMSVLKDDMLQRVIELINEDLNPRFYSVPVEPTVPVVEPSNAVVNDNNEDARSSVSDNNDDMELD